MRRKLLNSAPNMTDNQELHQWLRIAVYNGLAQETSDFLNSLTSIAAALSDQDKDGDTLLMLAAASGHEEITRIIVEEIKALPESEHNNLLQMQNNNHQTAADLAATAAIKQLIDDAIVPTHEELATSMSDDDSLPLSPRKWQANSSSSKSQSWQR